MGNIIWVKTLLERCMTKLRMDLLNQVNSLQSAQIYGIPHQVKDLRPFMVLKPSSGCDSDSEESECLVKLGSTTLRKPNASLMMDCLKRK